MIVTFLLQFVSHNNVVDLLFFLGFSFRVAYPSRDIEFPSLKHELLKSQFGLYLHSTLLQ